MLHSNVLVRVLTERQHFVFNGIWSTCIAILLLFLQDIHTFSLRLETVWLGDSPECMHGDIISFHHAYSLVDPLIVLYMHQI